MSWACRIKIMTKKEENTVIIIIIICIWNWIQKYALTFDLVSTYTPVKIRSWRRFTAAGTHLIIIVQKRLRERIHRRGSELFRIEILVGQFCSTVLGCQVLLVRGRHPCRRHGELQAVGAHRGGRGHHGCLKEILGLDGRGRLRYVGVQWAYNKKNLLLSLSRWLIVIQFTIWNQQGTLISSRHFITSTVRWNWHEVDIPWFVDWLAFRRNLLLAL